MRESASHVAGDSPASGIVICYQCTNFAGVEMAVPQERTDWLLATDEAILEELRQTRLDYPALIAARRGLHLGHVERRCDVLDASGLIERASPERTYRITELGRRVVDGDVDAAAIPRGD